MNKKSAYILIGILLIIAGIILLTKKSDVQTNQIIKIGAPLVLSGDSAAYGEAAKNAITIAALAYNARPEVVSGKVPHIEVVYESTRDGDPKAAVSAYKKLTSIDHVDALVGPLLQIEISALTPLIKQDGIPTIAIAPLAFDQRVNTKNPLAFWPDPTFESAKMADYVFDQGVRNVAVLTTKDPWETEVAQGFAEQFKKRGGVITDMESVLQDSKDVSLPTTRALATHPDALYLATYYKFEYFSKKAQELGYKGKSFGIEADSYLASVTNPYSNGTRFISPAYFTPEFLADYKNKYAVEPNIPAGQAYDAFTLFTKLILKVYSEKTPLSKAELQKSLITEIENVKEYSGVSGNIVFTPEHRATFPTSIFIMKDGKVELFK